MKLRQETTSLGKIATVAAKPRISDKERINTDMRRFKIQAGPLVWMGPLVLGAGFVWVLVRVILSGFKADPCVKN